MKDFSSWKEYEGASEGSGRSEKIWLINPVNNKIGLFKYKKDKITTDHASECIAYDAEKLIDKQTGERYSLEMIKKSIEHFGVFKDFLHILVFDFLIGNTDRHQSNWALIYEDEQYRLCPLYDNSSSLCAYVSDKNIDSYLGKDKILWKSLVDGKSKSVIRVTGYSSKQPTHLEVLKVIEETYSVETYDFVDKIITLMTKDAICDILYKYKEVLSAKRRDLILKFLLSKLQMLKECYRREEEDHVTAEW